MVTNAAPGDFLSLGLGYNLASLGYILPIAITPTSCHKTTEATHVQSSNRDVASIYTGDKSVILGGYHLAWVSCVWCWFRPLGNQITQWVNIIPNDGILHFFGLLGAEYLIPTNVESLSDVLTNRSYLFQKTSGLRRWTIQFFGEEIVVQEGEKHKKNRKSFAQVFNQRQVDKLKPIISSKATQIVNHLSEKCVNGDGKQSMPATLNLNKLTKLITLDVIGIVALGIDFNSILGQNMEIIDIFQCLFSAHDLKKSHFMWHNSAPSWLISMFPSKVDRQMEDAHAKLKTRLKSLITEKATSFKSTDISKQDILTQIACSKDFTPEEIVPQVVITLAAGFESTAGTLAWTLYCVAANPEGGAASRICMLTFLYGPRNRPGRALSLAEIRRMTARIIECFDIKTTSSVVPESSGWLSSAPAPDLCLTFSNE
ncbi:uncharacterized protein N7483_002386 [Penicillium malachiteum]|uniref:uncharacterized protein n=1 Tax=Penicillium malachiteum TaxID=1324776 RepID=UPI00254910FD|nr:uncharacterized protein N7483_002386 [Penicillium malachiteum]KAJ5737261.1 hypothetical protein N7483_002386 [Penicillium malachiteum]